MTRLCVNLWIGKFRLSARPRGGACDGTPPATGSTVASGCSHKTCAKQGRQTARTRSAGDPAHCSGVATVPWPISNANTRGAHVVRATRGAWDTALLSLRRMRHRLPSVSTPVNRPPAASHLSPACGAADGPAGGAGFGAAGGPQPLFFLVQTLTNTVGGDRARHALSKGATSRRRREGKVSCPYAQSSLVLSFLPRTPWHSVRCAARAVRTV